jgi:hypothetical protein
MTFTNISNRLTWDAYFCGSFISTLVFETAKSFVIVVVLTYHLARYHNLPYTPFYSVPILGSLWFIVLNIRAWYRGPKHIWMLGVKEVAAHHPSEHKLSVFGTRRKPEDEVRKVCATSWLPVIIYRAVWTTLKLSIVRRAVYVAVALVFSVNYLKS